MAKGTIRRLIADRGFGFIRTEYGGELLFRRNNLRGVVYSSLKEGQQVEFEIGRALDGRPRAVNVRLVQPESG